MCELCTARAVQEGWIREGTMPAYQTGDTRSDRRRSLLNRWRSRRDAAGPARAGSDDDYEPRPPGTASSPAPAGPFHAGAARRREHTREPRHVRAVPTSV